jgi:Na+/melibiose symporter-like transporter
MTVHPEDPVKRTKRIAMRMAIVFGAVSLVCLGFIPLSANLFGKSAAAVGAVILVVVAASAGVEAVVFFHASRRR